MTFSTDGLYQIGPGGKSPRVWAYSTDDNINNVRVPGYFNAASDLLTRRDIIFVFNTSLPSTTHIVTVLSNDNGVIDVTDGDPISETNEGPEPQPAPQSP